MSTDSGIETAVTTVVRQLARKRKTMMIANEPPMSPSRTTPLIELVMKVDWSKKTLNEAPWGSEGLILSSSP